VLAEGLYSTTLAIYAFPDDPRPEMQNFVKHYNAESGTEPNFPANAHVRPIAHEIGRQTITTCYSRQF
jgi:hypothetical protein